MRAPPGLLLHPKAKRRGRGREQAPAVSLYQRPSGQLDLHVDAGGEIELHQRVDRLRRRLHDVEQPFVGADLELLARLLVDVRRAVHGKLLDTRRQRNGAANERARAPGGVRDVAGRLVEHPMIERLQANADILRFHSNLPMRKSPPSPKLRRASPSKPPPRPKTALVGTRWSRTGQK